MSGAGTCSLAFSGNSQPYALNVSILKGTWVVDSGATDHMTQSSHGFVSYSPYPSNKKIAIADGTLVTVAGQGDVVINQNFLLKNVLHVPKLSTNLVSIHKLIKDLNYVCLISKSACKMYRLVLSGSASWACEAALEALEDARIAPLAGVHILYIPAVSDPDRAACALLRGVRRKKVAKWNRNKENVKRLIT